MSSRTLFLVSYVVFNLLPVYVIVGTCLGVMGAPGWLVLLPLFVIGLPFGTYLILYRCSVCKCLVYTVPNLKAVPDGLNKFPLHRFDHCPSCGAAL
jgi:hypothetical protein